MFGKFFKCVVGKPVSAFCGLIDVEKAAAKAKGVECLSVAPHKSNLITRRGNVFAYRNGRRDLDREIDQFLSAR